MILVCLFMFFSCSTKYTILYDYSERMEAVKANFPEIYQLYIQGDVVIDYVYKYEKKDGKSGVRISYHYR